MGTSTEDYVKQLQTESFVHEDVSMIVHTCSSDVKKTKSEWENSIKETLVDMLRIPNEKELLKIVFQLCRVLTKEASKDCISLKRRAQICKSITDILRSLKLVSVVDLRNSDDSLKLQMVGAVLMHLIQFLSKHTAEAQVVEEASQILRYLKNMLDCRMGWVLTVLLAACDTNNVGAIQMFIYQLLRLAILDIHKQQLEKGINHKLAAAENIIRLNAGKFNEKYRAELISSWKEGKNYGLLSSKNVVERIQECQQRLACLDLFQRLKQETSSLSEPSKDKPVKWELSSKPDLLLKAKIRDDESEVVHNSEADGYPDKRTSGDEELREGISGDEDGSESHKHSDDKVPQENDDYEVSDEEIDFSEDEDEVVHTDNTEDSNSDSDSDDERITKRVKLV